MAPAFRTWLAPRLADGRYFGFVAQTGDGVPAGGIGLMEIEWPPHPSHPLEDRRGYVLNVYVDPRYRNQGIARLLMEASDHVFQERGLSYVILHATDAGRRLYERIGWLPTSEMAKQLPPA
jgi:ribosomal protein S18 acetylase RimI-like enzyme